jgi:hypothetical protein
MAQLKSPKVRLAVPGSEAPEVFNFYQIISLISGLYLKGSEHEDVAQYKKSLDFCGESLLTQVGEAYDLLGLAMKSQKEGLPVPVDSLLLARTERFAKRMIVLDENLTMWTPVSRWARVLLLLERKLLRLAKQLSAHNPYVGEKIADMCVVIKKRSDAMEDVLKSALMEEQTLNGSFAVPVAL